MTMAETNLTEIFGTEIIVNDGHRQADRQFSGFAGAHGLTDMYLGSRGKEIVVMGTVRGIGETYAAARTDAASQLIAIEDCQELPAANYVFQGQTFTNVVWIDLKKIPLKDAAYLFSSAGEVIVRFIATGRSLD